MLISILFVAVVIYMWNWRKHKKDDETANGCNELDAVDTFKPRDSNYQMSETISEENPESKVSWLILFTA